MYDAVVVGAGPGGSLTAYRLAQQGVEVCLVEKEEMPRHKPCGGGLPPHAVTLLEELGIDLDEHVEYVADRVRFLFDFEDPVETDLSDAPVVMVNRADFDRGLVRRAVDRGCDYREGSGVVDLEQDGGGVTLELENGEQVRARFVVGADGAGSRVARSIEVERPSPPGVALDAEVEVDAETFEKVSDYATFNINFVDRGYGWIFPKDQYLAMGVGGYDTSQSYPNLVREYVERSLPGAEVQEMEVTGHPLPFFRESHDVADGRVALVGDAAYMVDSLSGEGIFYALKAGRIAADSVVEALETEQSDLQQYQSAIDETVMKELKWSARLASVFFKFPRKCYEHGVKRTAIVNLIKRVVRSEESYDEIYGALWDEIKQRLSPSTLGELAFR